MSLGYVLMPDSRIRFGLASGGGYYLTTGAVKTKGPGVDDRTDFEGSGFGAHGMAIALARLTRKLNVEVDAGYRYAKTTDVTSGGNRIRNADGSLAKIDWSGFMGRFGISYRVGRPNNEELETGN